MATNWVEEGTLADMKHRLEKLRIDQSRQKNEDEPGKKDTLKILQSKFGSPVYDPTSPLQKAYDRRCARTGRRKSIEFEDLYLTRGSGLLLQLPASPTSPKNRAGSAATSKKHPHPHLLHTSSGMDYSSQLSQLLSSSGGGGGGGDRRCARTGRRKSIEFEDLYLTRGSGLLLQLPASPTSPKNRAGSAATSKKHPHPPLLHTSSGMDYSSQLSQLLSSSGGGGGGGGTSSPTRTRKSSDPTSSHSRKWDMNGHCISKSHGTEGAAAGGGGGHKVGHGDGEGHKGQGHRGQGHRGILSVTLSEEDKKVIDKKLARIGGGSGGGNEGEGEGKSSPQRRRKLSKTGSKH